MSTISTCFTKGEEVSQCFPEYNKHKHFNRPIQMRLSHSLLCIAGAVLILARPGVAVGDCGCPECTSSILNKDAGGHSVRNRIDWLIANKGQSEQKACSTGEDPLF